MVAGAVVLCARAAVKAGKAPLKPGRSSKHPPAGRVGVRLVLPRRPDTRQSHPVISRGLPTDRQTRNRPPRPPRRPGGLKSLPGHADVTAGLTSRAVTSEQVPIKLAWSCVPIRYSKSCLKGYRVKLYFEAPTSRGSLTPFPPQFS